MLQHVEMSERRPVIGLADERVPIAVGGELPHEHVTGGRLTRLGRRPANRTVAFEMNMVGRLDKKRENLRRRRIDDAADGDAARRFRHYASPSSCTVSSRISTLRTLPVMVIGNSSTTWT